MTNHESILDNTGCTLLIPPLVTECLARHVPEDMIYSESCLECHDSRPFIPRAREEQGTEASRLSMETTTALFYRVEWPVDTSFPVSKLEFVTLNPARRLGAC